MRTQVLTELAERVLDFVRPPRLTQCSLRTGFLQRPELNACWDLRIYVDVSFETVLRRGTERDQQWMTSAAAAEERYRSRYMPGERMYIDQADPRARAQVVLGNEDPANPTLTYN